MQNINAAIEDKDGNPVVVEDYDDAYLAKRRRAIREAPNPIVEAAHPLTRAQADISGIPKLRRRQVETLRALLAREVRTFETLCYQANLERDQVVMASYTLCSALDEAAMHTRWGGGKADAGLWARMSLSSEFHRDREGGVNVYKLIARAVDDVHGQRDLIELFFLVMSLGFKGRYRIEPDGDQRHEHIRLRLYQLVAPLRPAVPKALSVHVAPTTERNFHPIWTPPVWITAVVLIVLLLAGYGYGRYQLNIRAESVARQIEQIGNLGVVVVPETPTDPGQGSVATSKPSAENGSSGTERPGTRY